jgi:hypothetical protein
MATEDIKVRDGRIQVERVAGKDNVDVAASDVDSVTFTRGGWGGTGALVLHTENGDVVIRVENDDAGEALKKVRAVVKEDNEEEPETELTQDNEVPPAAPTQTSRATNARRK